MDLAGEGSSGDNTNNAAASSSGATDCGLFSPSGLKVRDSRVYLTPPPGPVAVTCDASPERVHGDVQHAGPPPTGGGGWSGGLSP